MRDQYQYYKNNSSSIFYSTYEVNYENAEGALFENDNETQRLKFLKQTKDGIEIEMI